MRIFVHSYIRTFTDPIRDASVGMHYGVKEGTDIAGLL